MDRLNQRLLALAGGEIERLIVSMPPRFGKSELCSHYLVSWWAGAFPGSEIVIASYEHDFASSWAVKARRTFSEVGGALFEAGLSPDQSRQDSWRTSLGSSVFATGVGGPLTGRGADLAVLDDPVKNSEEANSATYREKTAEWFHSTLMTRLHNRAKVLVIGTRWHTDDLIGRILAAQDTGGDRWEVLNLPALDDAGESLCADLFPADVLRQKRAAMGEYLFSTMYMGSPYIREGGLFRVGSIGAAPSELGPEVRRVRAWDLAASPMGDYTVGLLLTRLPGDQFVIEDVVRGRWRPGERDAVIKKTADHDPVGTCQVFEEEGGSGGKAQVDSLRERLLGSWVDSVRHTGDKVVRAGPVASAAEVGRILMVEGAWKRDFLAELEAFPTGAHDDQVDALSLAFNYLFDKRVIRIGPPTSGRAAATCSCVATSTGLFVHHPRCEQASREPSFLEELDRKMPVKGWPVY